MKSTGAQRIVDLLRIHKRGLWTHELWEKAGVAHCCLSKHVRRARELLPKGWTIETVVKEGTFGEWLYCIVPDYPNGGYKTKCPKLPPIEWDCT